MDWEEKHCNEKLLELNLKWDTTVDWFDCTEINFPNQLVEIQKIINNWNKQYLTPIGKITIIKTFIMSKSFVFVLS